MWSVTSKRNQRKSGLVTNRDISVGIVSRQWAWLPGFRIPAREETFLRRNVHAHSGDRPASCLMGTADYFPGVKRPGLEVNYLVSLVPRLKMSGAMPLVAIYSCTFTSSFNALPQQLQPTLGISSPAVPLHCSTVSRLQRAPEERVQIHEMRETRSFIHPPFLSWTSLPATKNSIPMGCELWAISILGSHVYGLNTRL
jgi:hypothetical protein